MAELLSNGAIMTILSGGEVLNPVLQLLSSRKLSGNATTDRYRLLISDGIYSNSYAMLATERNHLIEDNQLTEFSIIRVNKYLTSTVYNKLKKMEEKRVMILLDITVLKLGSKVGFIIGNPEACDGSQKPTVNGSALAQSQISQTTSAGSTMADSVSFKAYLKRDGQDVEVRRFGIDTGAATNYMYLRGKIQAMFPSVQNDEFSVFWQDVDNDYITIDSDEELVLALSSCSVQPIKLYVHIKSRQQAPGGGNKDAHPGVTCDSCNGPVTGFRYKCVTCSDYDLCAMCEAAGLHPEHFMFRMPTPMGFGVPGCNPKLFRKFFKHPHKSHKRHGWERGVEDHVGWEPAGPGRCPFNRRENAGTGGPSTPAGAAVAGDVFDFSALMEFINSLKLTPGVSAATEAAASAQTASSSQAQPTQTSSSRQAGPGTNKAGPGQPGARINAQEYLNDIGHAIAAFLDPFDMPSMKKLKIVKVMMKNGKKGGLLAVKPKHGPGPHSQHGHGPKQGLGPHGSGPKHCHGPHGSGPKHGHGPHGYGPKHGHGPRGPSQKHVHGPYESFGLQGTPKSHSPKHPNGMGPKPGSGPKQGHHGVGVKRGAGSRAAISSNLMKSFNLFLRTVPKKEKLTISGVDVTIDVRPNETETQEPSGAQQTPSTAPQQTPSTAPQQTPLTVPQQTPSSVPQQIPLTVPASVAQNVITGELNVPASVAQRVITGELAGFYNTTPTPAPEQPREGSTTPARRNSDDWTLLNRESPVRSDAVPMDMDESCAAKPKTPPNVYPELPTETPSAPPQADTDRQRIHEAIEKIRAMGFDFEKAVLGELLRRENGDIATVLEMILNGKK